MVMDMSAMIRGEINELHRRYCYHCRQELVYDGHQIGKFMGIDKLQVVCPACNEETGCFRSLSAITLRRTEILILNTYMAKVKRYPKLYGLRRKDEWKFKMFGMVDTTKKDMNESIMDYHVIGLKAFKKKYDRACNKDDDNDDDDDDDASIAPDDYDETDDTSCFRSS